MVVLVRPRQRPVLHRRTSGALCGFLRYGPRACVRGVGGSACSRRSRRESVRTFRWREIIFLATRRLRRITLCALSSFGREVFGGGGSEPLSERAKQQSRLNECFQRR